MRRINHTKRGDTVVEVIFAITIFCLVAIISITLMNSGINTAQGSLELTMARNEIDAQAEALRFIQNSFLAERGLAKENQQYTELWRRITRGEQECDYDYLASCGLAIEPEQLADFDITTCAEAYEAPTRSIRDNNAFVINTRLVQPSDTDADFIQDFFFGISTEPNYKNLMSNIIISSKERSTAFIPAPIYPRLLFTHHGHSDEFDSDLLVETDETRTHDQLYRVVASVEGIWVIAVRGGIRDDATKEPEFFDFYIRTCWYEPGNDYPTAIGTIVRLYNPEIIE